MNVFAVKGKIHIYNHGRSGERRGRGDDRVQAISID